MVLGQPLAAFGYFALAGADAETSYDIIVGPLLRAGVGVALTLPSMAAAVLESFRFSLNRGFPNQVGSDSSFPAGTEASMDGASILTGSA
jgi:hypothetical protein